MSVDGTYKLTVNTPQGVQTPTLTLKEDAGALSGTLDGQAGKSGLAEVRWMATMQVGN